VRISSVDTTFAAVCSSCVFAFLQEVNEPVTVVAPQIRMAAIIQFIIFFIMAFVL
jgi:hypothetical protein